MLVGEFDPNQNFYRSNFQQDVSLSVNSIGFFIASNESLQNKSIMSLSGQKPVKIVKFIPYSKVRLIEIYKILKDKYLCGKKFEN